MTERELVCTATTKLYADTGCDNADNRWLCKRDRVQPHIRKIGEPDGSGLGKVRRAANHPRTAHSGRHLHHR